MSGDADHTEVSWSLAGYEHLKAEHLSSLLKYVISNGSSMELDEIILSIHVIGTSLDKCMYFFFCVLNESRNIIYNSSFIFMFCSFVLVIKSTCSILQ